MATKGDDIVLVDSDTEVEQALAKRPKLDTPEPTRLATPVEPEHRFSLKSDDEDDTGELGFEDEVAHPVDRSGHDLASESEFGTDDLDLSGELAMLPLGMAIEDITPEVIEKTRRYLKRHGNAKFLERYLPMAAGADEIIRVIVMLGFMPRRIPSMDEANLMGLIGFLNSAMVKVSKMRTRRDDVATPGDALAAITRANRILVITGAGILTSLGIPDFRSSQGFYNMIQGLGLSDPQEVFDLENFHADPSLFYLIALMILPPENVFLPLHAFIRLLQDKGKLLRNYTQNIDNLESYAGIDPAKLVQCHGLFATATCVTCRTQVPGETVFPAIRAKEIAYCPQCAIAKKKILRKDDDAYLPELFGVYKPDITFFGELLPRLFHDTIRQDLGECDLLISVGTLLKVAPVADIVDKVPEHVPQILINKDAIDHCNFDVSLLGYCDDVASYVCNQLGPEWDIPHPRYNEIRGENGDNLVLEAVDTVHREYDVVNLKEAAARAAQEEAEAAAEAAADAADAVPEPTPIPESYTPSLRDFEDEDPPVPIPYEAVLLSNTPLAEPEPEEPGLAADDPVARPVRPEPEAIAHPRDHFSSV